MKIERVVIDTNVLISAALLDDSVPARARNHAIRYGQLVATEQTFAELTGRLLEPKFDRYVSRATRETFLKRLQPIIEIVPVIQVVRACRDPRDDMFLEAAVNGRADVVVTGDKDLLALHPFAGIAIVTPSNYLAMVEPESE
ncbi:MAG: putative toxin-antitoxin system toxin component, PIN family [Acidobacteriota bacterium]|nr:putative toxin-antitoxin system toxin component, PIN family [Acidobacteriota bacterium]